MLPDLCPARVLARVCTRITFWRGEGGWLQGNRPGRFALGRRLLVLLFLFVRPLRSFPLTHHSLHTAYTPTLGQVRVDAEGGTRPNDQQRNDLSPLEEPGGVHRAKKFVLG